MKVRAAVGVPVGALLLGLAACGTGDEVDKASEGSSEAVAAVREAASTTARAGSSRTRSTMTMTSGDRTTVLNGEGIFDYGKRMGHLTLQVPKDSGFEGPIEEIVTPEALYLKNGSPGVPKDRWVRVDLTQLADGNVISGGSTDPSTSFEILRGVNDDVRLVGEETLGDVRVRHYRGTLDLRKAAAQAPDNAKAPLAAALRSFATTTVPFDAYLDGEGRLRKVQEEFTLAAGGQGQSRSATVLSAAELYDFGVPVTVTPPRQEEVYVVPGPGASPVPAVPPAQSSPSAAPSVTPSAAPSPVASSAKPSATPARRSAAATAQPRPVAPTSPRSTTKKPSPSAS
jgi:hypothetical protein